MFLAAAAAHAQVSVSPAAVTIYQGATTNLTVTIPVNWAVVLPVVYDSGVTSASIAGTTPGARPLTITTAAGATGTSSVTLTTSNTLTSATSPLIIPITFRERPTLTDVALAADHLGHLHSGPGAVETSTLTGTLSNIATFTAVSGNPALFTVTAGPVPSLADILVTPFAGASGTAVLTVTGRDSVLGGTVAFPLSITVRPALIVSNISPNPLTFAEDTSGNLTFRVNACLPFTAANVSYTMTEPYAPYHYIIASNTTTLAVSGGTTNLTTTFFPSPDAYGVVTARLDIAVGTVPYTYSSNIVIRVTPVPDAPKITGLPSEIIMSNKDPWTNAFINAVITDPDDYPPPPAPPAAAIYKEPSNVVISNALNAIVFGGLETSVTNAPANRTVNLQTDWLQGMSLKVLNGLPGAIGTTNTYTVLITATDTNGLSCVTSVPVRVWFKNTPPVFTVNLKSPGLTVTEGYPESPFKLDQLVDPDIGQTHTLKAWLAPESTQYGYLTFNGATPGTVTVGTDGNLSSLDAALRNLQFTAYDGVMTNETETLFFIFEMYDGFDSTINTNTFTLVQQKRPPVITLGGTPGPFNITSELTTPMRPFPQTTVTDPDEGGNQFVYAEISVNPLYLSLANTEGIGENQHPTSLTALLRSITFLPNLASSSPLYTVPIGESVSAVITIKATDKYGLASEPRSVTVNIDRLNAAPIITVPVNQPVLFSPGSTIYPFEHINLENDDPHPVTFTFVADNANKGSFGNTAGLTPSGNGFTITDTTANILAIVTNVTFTLNPAFAFPPDSPGGTLFSLSAQDAFLASTSADLAILVQDPPRNWLVTRLLDDGAPGSLSHALERFGNNDVITFALDDYPATIRLSDTPAITANKALTIKGPGADLLTLSGDVNGNGKPDRRFMTVAAPVVLEGLTLADCTGDYGGAVSVIARGHLTLRSVTIRNCIATGAGGAIDVDHGQLTAESSMFLDNATSLNAYDGGGAVSLFTDTYITFRNCIFARNHQGCVGGMGGGAIFAEFPGDSPWFLDIDVINCTFVDNEDQARNYGSLYDPQGTSIFAYGACAFYLADNIFSDDPWMRTLNTSASGEIISFGGNVCNNDATVFQNQGGGSPQKNLLNHMDDQTNLQTVFDASLAPLNLSPMAYHANIPVSTDAAGRIRNIASTLPGALDPAAAAFPTITEIQLAEGFGSGDRFIEIYAPRNSKTPVNLQGMTLAVNGVAVHTFGQGAIANPTGLGFYAAGTNAAFVSAAHLLEPGHGVVIVFPALTNAPVVAMFQLPMASDNPTPVVRASIISNAVDFADLTATGRGQVEILSPYSPLPVVRHTFLTDYNDPESATGTDPLDLGIQSIATLPQARGFAFVPHAWNNNPLLESPGATSEGTPFGGDNAPPIARNDSALGTEDDITFIDVLANDTDPDDDPIFILSHDLSSTLGVAITLDPDTGMLRYNPIGNPAIQALPASREVIDTFTYTILDGLPLTLANVDFTAAAFSTFTCTTADGMPHGLNVNRKVWVEGLGYIVHDVPAPDVFVLREALPEAFADTLLANTVYTRNPANAATATVTITLEGLNDNPVGVPDDLRTLITDLTERTAVRILAHPDLANSATFPDYPETPAPNIGLLANDLDVDEGDTPDTFRITGILSDDDVHPVTALTAAGPATRVTSPGHGLASGTTVTLLGAENPARVNGAWPVTVIDDNTFDIPATPGTFLCDNAVWIPTSTAQAAITPLGASVTLNNRANFLEDNVVYDASVSAQLRKLGEGQSVADGFWYILVDKYNAPGLAYVTLTVNGVNDAPDVTNEPPAVDDLLDFFDDDDLLDILTNRVNVLTVLVPPASGAEDRADLIIADKATTSLTTADLLLLADFFSTDENTPLVIHESILLARATDIDTNDTLTVSGTAPSSLLGATVSITAGNVTYDPRTSSTLRALGIGETAFDVFTVDVSDGLASTPMRVVVLVRGVNNKPIANPVYLINTTLANWVTFTPNVTDADIHDIFPDVTVEVPDVAQPTNAIPYTITDHSLFLAMDDTFRLPYNTGVTTLDILANDVNFHGTGITLVSVTPSLAGGTVSVNNAGTALLYTPPADFAGLDIFTYSITNALGIVRKANVRAYVILNDFNGPLHACDDAYAVARGMSLTMSVLDNDVMLPNAPAGLTIDPTYAADWPAGLTLSGNALHYTAATAESEIRFHYRALGGGGAASVAQVRIKIIDRHTSIQPDYVTVAPGAPPVTLDLLANDMILGDSNEGMLITALDTTGTAGTVTIAPDQRTATYAAPAGFIGVDIFTYTAVDRYGAQGTASVFVTVGIPIAAPVSITVATNTTTLIDVLASDTVLPYAPPTSLTLTDVFLRNGETANGTATLAGDTVSFEAGLGINASAVWLYTYAVPNTSLIMTGQLAIVTSHGNAFYASADNAVARKNSTAVTINALANDISYRPGHYPLTIQSVQLYSERGGTVTTDGALLYYTPPTGYEGIDTFSYIASDGIGLESGFVTVNVVPGDLIVNDDAFIIGYEWDNFAGAPKAYTLPVLGNDSVFPGGGAFAIVGFGIGADAPSQGGTVSSPDGQTVSYRPATVSLAPGDEFTETFTYEVEDTYGRKQSARVTVTVRQRTTGIEAETQDDAFNVERNSIENILPVTANDLVEPKTPLPSLGIHVTAPEQTLGTVRTDGLNLIYTPPTGFVGIDTITYTITDGLGGTGSATVTVFVGALPTATDAFSVLRGTTTDLDILANDPITQSYLASYQTALHDAYGATHGGTASINGTKISYTPDPAYAGPYPYTEQFTYELRDQSARTTTGQVLVTVHDLADSQSTSIVYVIHPDHAILPGSPRDIWNTFHFGPGYISDPASAGGASPMGDGVSNDAKYAFGADPTVFDPTAGKILIRMLPGDTASLTYTYRSNDPALTFTLHSCDDLTLADWQPVTDDTFSSVTHALDTTLRIATHNIPTTAIPRRFFKIIVGM